MTITDLPPSRRYTIRVTDPDGQSRRLGRMRAEVTPDSVTVLNRTGQPYQTWPLVGVAKIGSAWTLTAEDGTMLTLSGCGCGS